MGPYHVTVSGICPDRAPQNNPVPLVGSKNRFLEATVTKWEGVFHVIGSLYPMKIGSSSLSETSLLDWRALEIPHICGFSLERAITIKAQDQGRKGIARQSSTGLQ